MSKCGGCGKFLSGGATNNCTCAKCRVLYHRQCVNLPTSADTPKNWICPSCAVKIPRTNNTDTPIKQQVTMQSSPQPMEQGPSLRSEKPADGSEQSLLLQELRALRQEMNNFRKDFGCFKEEVRGDIKNLRDMYQGFNDGMEHFKERLENQESRLVAAETAAEAAREEVTALKDQVQSLKDELQNREQLALQNDIEISGVTEQSGENVIHVTGLIMNKIGLTVDERDIVEARRVGPVRLDSTGAQRPRPIVLRVTRRAVHEQVLRCARTRRNITTGDVNVAGAPRNIYINERLTRQNRVLFGQVRSLCKHNKWRYTWTRDGKIFARESDGKPAFRIRREDDCDKLFKRRPSNG